MGLCCFFFNYQSLPEYFQRDVFVTISLPQMHTICSHFFGCNDELLAENLAYLSKVSSVACEKLRKLDKWRINEEVADLKIYLQHMNGI